MSNTKLNSLLFKIVSMQRTNDPIRSVYWFKHFTRLLSLVRNNNLGLGA